MSGCGFSFQRTGVEVGIRAKGRAMRGRDWAASVGCAAEEGGGGMSETSLSAGGNLFPPFSKRQGYKSKVGGGG